MGLASAGAFAQFTINELFVNPQGTDDGFEYAEIKGTPGASLTGISFVSIEGDGAGAGLADRVVDLSSFSLGSNGLLLIRFGSGISSLEPATTVVDAFANGALENGSNSWGLFNFVPTSGLDLDTDNDGLFDLASGQSALDVVGWTEGPGTSEVAYGFKYDQATIGTFTPDAFYRVGNGDARVFGDVITAIPATTGISDFDVAGINRVAVYSTYRGLNSDGSTTRDADWESWADSGYAQDSNALNLAKLTPGGANPVPEPASMAVLGLGILGLARRPRNK